jgi:cellulose biosynthesis protein BcsQ
MRIQLAVLDEDPLFLTRLQSHLTAAHGSRIEVIAFTDPATALAAIAGNRTHVFLAHETFEIDPDLVPARCEFAYLADSAQVESIRGVRTVPKYAAVDDFFRSVTTLFNAASESMQIRSRRTGGSSRMVAFTSPAGGVGTTSVALAFARALAMQPTPLRTLYVGLDSCDDTSARFGLTDPTHGTFSDVVYTVKRRRGDLQMQLESHTYQDSFGTYFFASAAQPTDVLELRADDLALLTEQLGAGGFDAVVLDVPFALDEATLRILDACAQVVLLSDGRPGANAKVLRAIAGLEIVAAQHELSVLPQTGLLYNKFSSHLGERLDEVPVTELGGINRFEGAPDSQVVDAIFASGRLDTLVASVLA